jgi:hypothetical protein
MMDMIRTNLMTMTMMNSINGNSNKENNNNGMFGMIYLFIITGLIDIISKYVIPNLIIICKEYYNEKSNKLINIIDSTKNNIKSSSITIQVNTSDLDNVLGQALLDYITNNKNTKHISYEKRNFVLNQCDIIEISEDFFINRGLKKKKYYVATWHRRENVHIESSVKSILKLLSKAPLTVYMPTSYRTQKVLKEMKLIIPKNVIIVDPVGYNEFLVLMTNSAGVITDSGTVVEETSVLGIPSLQMRKATERPQTYDSKSSVKFDPTRPQDYPAEVIFKKLNYLLNI